MAVKQAHAYVFFQALDLAADGGLGKSQFFRGGAEVEVAGDGLKSAQLACGNGPGTQVCL
jgi:hypothetical protein